MKAHSVTFRGRPRGRLGIVGSGKGHVRGRPEALSTGWHQAKDGGVADPAIVAQTRKVMQCDTATVQTWSKHDRSVHRPSRACRHSRPIADVPLSWLHNSSVFINNEWCW